MKNIKHIVLSGGGLAGVIEYGIIKHLMANKELDMDNIISMYGTSIGSWLAVCFSLNYDIQKLYNKRLKMYERDEIFFNALTSFIRFLIDKK